MTGTNGQDVYTAAILIIGNEILSGRTQDLNTAWIAEKLSEQGIALNEVRIIPDIEDDIVRTVNELRPKFDYVFTTGGIGPTHDDITAESIAKAFGTELELNPEAYKALVTHYGSEGDVTPPRKKMALIPKGARLISNPVSGAPGFQVQNVFVMAGVPRIMRAMLDEVLARLKKGPPILSNTVACALTESLVAEDLAAIQAKYPSVTVGSYPHFRGGLLGLSLVVRSTDDKNAHLATHEIIEMVTRLGGEPPSAISIQTQGV